MAPVVSWVQTFERDHPNAFALTVVGDSMQPEFTKGGIIIIAPELEPVSGSYIVAKNGAKTTFKQFVMDGRSVPETAQQPVSDP